MYYTYCMVRSEGKAVFADRSLNAVYFANRTNQGTSWHGNSTNDWIEIDLQKSVLVTSITTKGT